jgi:large subunit ribosomal protein L21
MDMYALVEILGKQYKAEKGKTLTIDRLEKEKGEKVVFDSVLLLSDEGNIKIGSPFIKGTRVKATIEDHGKAKKVVIYKYKKRKNYRRKRGFRASFTKIKVDDITASGK